MDTPLPASSPIARQTLRRITWRLIPFLCLLYLVAYLDRINISFAALQMNQDLGLSAVAYVTGAGLFFLGCCMVIGMYGIALWLPQMLRALTQVGDFTLGLVNAIPFLAAALGMVMIGWSSDRHHERRWHVAGSLWLAATGSLLAAGAHTLPLALLGFSVAAVGLWGVMGPFWALATSFLSGAAAAGGIALINSLGNIGGFVGPDLMGWFKQLTDGYSAGLTALAVILLMGGALVLAVRPSR